MFFILGVSLVWKTKFFIGCKTPHTKNENFFWKKKKIFSLIFVFKKILNFSYFYKKYSYLEDGKSQNIKYTDSFKTAK